MLCKTEALQNFTSFIRKHPCSKPSNLQLYFKEHHHWWFSVDIYQIFFHCFISRKYAFTDVLQNRCSWKLRKIHRKSPLPDSLDSDTDNFLRIFLKFLGTPFLQNTSDCFWFQFHLFTVSRSFCFRTGQYLLNIPSYFRVCQNSWPPAH